MGKLIRNGIEFGGSAEQASRISYDNSDSIIHATNLQGAIDELAGGSQSLFVPRIRTVNGLDLSTDRTLKSAQFAESVTGEKMVASLQYSPVSTWDSGAKKAIKLEGDTYLHASGIVGIKETLSSGNLNDFYGFQNAGLYYLNASSASFTNGPTGMGWGAFVVIANNTTQATTQLCINGNTIFIRQLTGNPLAWTVWRKVTAFDVVEYTTNTASVSANDTGWLTINATIPSGYTALAPITYYLQGTGAANCTIYALLGGSIAVYNPTSSPASVTVSGKLLVTG